MGSKKDFYERERLEITSYYRRLRAEKKSRTEALNTIQLKYDYSHSTLRQIISNKNYRNLAARDLETNNRAKSMEVNYTAA